MWERRIAIVATYRLIRAGSLDDTFALAALLEGDRHDLMHKAVGWMLREAGKQDEARLLAFLDEHAATMPRTALRYSLERLSPEVRAHYMGARSALRSGALQPVRVGHDAHDVAERVDGRRRDEAAAALAGAVVLGGAQGDQARRACRPGRRRASRRRAAGSAAVRGVAAVDDAELVVVVADRGTRRSRRGRSTARRRAGPCTRCGRRRGRRRRSRRWPGRGRCSRVVVMTPLSAAEVLTF